LVLDPERSLTDFVQSPDGEWIVFRTADAASRDILAMRPGVDSVARPLLASPTYDEVAPALSPDGRWLAYSSNETGAYQIYVRPFPNVEDGRWQVSSVGAAAPRWSHSGNEIFFGNYENEILAAHLDTSTGFRVLRTEVLFTMTNPIQEGNTNGWYDVAPDDQRLIMARRLTTGGDSAAPELILVQNFFEELKRLAPN
jgi:Tol biopolymer transport system component